MNKGRSAFAGTLAIAALTCLGSAGPASAADIGHVFSFSFAGSGTNALTGGITAVDVDNSGGSSQGDVYVADGSTHRVLKFDPTGNFILMFGDGVNATTGGDVCTAASGNTCQPGSNGNAAGQLDNPRYIAVDNSSGPNAGSVYVATTNNQMVQRFSSGGALDTSFGTGGLFSGGTNPHGSFSSIFGIDADNSGNLLVFDNNQSGAYKFDTSGTYGNFFTACRGHNEAGFAVAPGGGRFYKVDGSPDLQVFTGVDGQCGQISQGTSATGLNVDNVTGTLYASFNGGAQVNEYKFEGTGSTFPDWPLSASGTPCEQVYTEQGCEPTHAFGNGQLSEAKGIGVDSATNVLYVADSGNARVAVYVSLPAPLPVTEDPVGNTTVSGTVKPDGAGEVVECLFEYGVTPESGPPVYTGKKACSPAAPYTVDTAVTADLGPLTGEQEYDYRLVAKNAAGARNFGQNKKLTPHNVKGLTTEAASGVTRTEAVLHASFEGDGTPTTYRFEWGTASNLKGAEKSTEESAGSPGFPPRTSLSFTPTGLAPETTYYFRVVATNTTGVSPAQILSFTTPPAVSGVVTGPAGAITEEGFELTGEFDGNGESTHYYFEYGKTTEYGQTFPVPPVDAGSPDETTPVSYEITEFAAYSTYHYRLVAENPVGKTAGGDMTVSTLPAPLPDVAGSSASSVGATEATIGASINPNHAPTTFRIQFGTDTSYAGKTLTSDSIGTAGTPQQVTEVLTELSPGSTYHYRVVATNFTGTTYGSDQSFTTLAAPSIASATGSALGQDSAQLTATLVPNGSPTDVHFVYGATTGYGQSSETVSAGSGREVSSVAVNLSGLAPGTTYHAAAVAGNAIGAVTGTDFTFTTAAAPQPQPAPPVKCKKGFVKKKGKCVRKKQPKPKKHHKSGGKK